MKTISQLCVATFLLMLASCDNMLDANPESFVSSEEYFQNEQQIKLAVNGAYAPLQRLADDVFWIATEFRSDNTSYTQHILNKGRVTQIRGFDLFQLTTTNDEVEELWAGLYSGISRCNMILDRIDNVAFSSKAKENQYTGEALFLRAYYYFYLARSFGGVPLVAHPVSSPAEAYAEGRASIDEVYNQIIQDASSAAKKLPTSYPPGEVGGATEGAARTLLAKVYMTRHKFQKAIEQLKKVTDLGYSLLPNYAALFDPTNKNNEETIFAIQYLEGDQGESSDFIYSFAPWRSGDDIVGDNQLTTGGAGFNIPTPSIIDAYEPGDLRKEASVAFWVSPEGDVTVPYIKKYDNPHSLPGRTNDNWPVFRYADVLLMLAEALNEVGQTQQAYPYINKVRERAGLAPLPPGLSQAEFREAVYHEQRVELAFENHRWFNLLRTGRAIEVMTAHGRHQNQLKPWLSPGTYNVKEYKLLYPIPQSQISLNSALEQNPGW